MPQKTKQSKLLQDLNEKQREAVTAPLGPVLILAGAGSGKTRALTYRLAYLLEQGRFEPEEILALTFTNKAADEMKQRVFQLLATAPSSGESKVTMGTFHSVCVRILRADIEQLGTKYDRHFVIYDADDQQKLVKQIVLELDLADQFKPQAFSYYISQAKTRMVEPEKLDLGREFFQEKLQEVYQEYQRRLVLYNALDFDDLLNVTVQLLQAQKKVLTKYQKRFKYILVDEYQDTNHAQYLLLKLLAEKHRNLFVVGDDAQSIYGFRGANMQNILDFKDDYQDAKVVKLEQNYRSTQNILNAANRVIRLNKSQYEKELWTDNGSGSRVYLFEAGDDRDESEFVVNSILHNGLEAAADEPEYDYSQADEDYGILSKYMKKPDRRVFQHPRVSLGHQVPDNLDETVVLYRTHAQSRAFEEALMGAGIPYQIVGGIRFYERKEIKDTLAHLKLIVNPKDLVSLQRVINEPSRGIGRVSFKEIRKALVKYQHSFTRLLNNLDDVLLNAAAMDGAKKFFQTLTDAAKLKKNQNILEVMELVLSKSGYKDYILDGSPEGEVRWANIEELFNVAAKHRQYPWQEGLHLFLEEVQLMTDLDKLEDDQNRLTLMTLHSVKGLEFDRVFLAGLEEGLLPHSRSLTDPQELEEEIRLAYVGMTRAREELYLSWAQNRRHYGELKKSAPSRVLKVIPESLIEKL